MFLSKSDEETTSNRKLAKDLVDKWVMWHMFKSLRTYIRFLPCLYFCYLWKAVALIWWKMVVLKVEIDGGYASSLFKNHVVVIHFPLFMITFYLKRSNNFFFAMLYWYVITQLVVYKCSCFNCKILILKSLVSTFIFCYALLIYDHTIGCLQMFLFLLQNTDS